jgi:multicomponent Na+:H+ antiporter subunit E
LRTSAGLFALLFGTWLLWSGHFTPMLMGFGLASCALVLLLARRMGIVDREGFPMHLAPRILRYLPWLTLEVIKSNLDLARRVLSVRIPIAPELVALTASQRTDLGRVSYANSITLTPSTVTIEVDSDGAMLIHAISPAAADGLRSGDMDRQVTRMEGPG